MHARGSFIQSNAGKLECDSSVLNCSLTSKVQVERDWHYHIERKDGSLNIESPKKCKPSIDLFFFSSLISSMLAG